MYIYVYIKCIVKILDVAAFSIYTPVSCSEHMK